MMHRKQDAAMFKAALIALVAGVLIGYWTFGEACENPKLEEVKRDVAKALRESHCRVAPRDCK